MPRRQDGYTLLVLLLALMSMGGIVAAGFTQQVRVDVERQQFLHNQQVLREAKRALLMYAYEYPDRFGRGPGRLPCPDMDNDGDADPINNCELVAGTGNVGRLPWNANGLLFYDARDASGERLWYAVSSNFNHFDPNDRINSATTGTISIHDQTGQRIFDGSVDGIAAVIIAPGPAIERAGALQDRDPLNVNDPNQYLDVAGLLDNANFINGDADDGFVVGPIDNLATGNLLVNDQLIFITSNELRSMASRRVLDAYRDAVVAYDDRIETDTAVPGEYYPWLFNYAVDERGSGNYPEISDFPAPDLFATERANFLQNWGRVPSIYATYFSDTDSQPIESELEVRLALNIPTAPGDVVGFTQTLSACPSVPSSDCAGGVIDFDAPISDVILLAPSSVPLDNVWFDDLGDPDDGLQRLSGTYLNDDSVTIVRYFWDEFPPSTNGYLLCPNDGDELLDCSQDSGGNPNPGGANQTTMRLLEVTMNISLVGARFFDLDTSAGTPPPLPVIEIASPADINGHAQIRASFAGGRLNTVTLGTIVNVTYRFDPDYLNSFVSESIGGQLDLPDLLNDGNLQLSLRYYPELPDWVEDNRWGDTIMLAYAPNYQPNVATTCAVGTDCLQLTRFGGVDDNKISLLLESRQGWTDADNNNSLANDVALVFDPENANADNIFNLRLAGSDDDGVVVCERTAGGSQCF